MPYHCNTCEKEHNSFVICKVSKNEKLAIKLFEVFNLLMPTPKDFIWKNLPTRHKKFWYKKAEEIKYA